MTRNPFRIKDILSEDLQDKFLGIKCNSTAKDDFEAMFLNDVLKQDIVVHKVSLSTAYSLQ